MAEELQIAQGGAQEMNAHQLALCAGLAGLILFAGQGVSHAQDGAQVEKGRETFTNWCAPCHGTGKGIEYQALKPGTLALQRKYRGTVPAALEDRSDLPFAVLKVFVRQGVWSMPGFRKTEISDDEIAAIASYLAESSKTPRGPLATGTQIVPTTVE